MTQTKKQKAKGVILTCLLLVNDLPEWTMNAERDRLYEALSFLHDDEIESAISSLGQGVEHAYRENFSETRPEAQACKAAFDVLTGKDDVIG